MQAIPSGNPTATRCVSRPAIPHALHLATAGAVAAHSLTRKSQVLPGGLSSDPKHLCTCTIGSRRRYHRELQLLPTDVREPSLSRDLSVPTAPWSVYTAVVPVASKRVIEEVRAVFSTCTSSGTGI